MIVFSTFLKIIKKYYGLILLYLVIFTIFSVIFASTNKQNNVFTAKKPNIAIVNMEDSPLMKSFLTYIKKNSNIVEIAKEDLKDALFNRKVDLILNIPDNFSNDFLNNKNPEIKFERVPDSYSSTYALMYLNRYLNLANLYNINNISEEKLIGYIEKDLKEESEVVFIQKAENNYTANYLYNFSNYSVMAMTIMILSLVMSSFKKEVIKKRNMISPISYKKQNRQLFVFNLIITLAVWLIFIIMGIFFFKTAMFNRQGLLLILNLLVFCLTVLSIGFLIGNHIQNKEVMGAINNVITLGTSFICGAFVPQEILGESVLRIAKIFPSYWFIKNNDLIVILTNYNIDNLKPIIINMGIVLLFGLLFYIINLIILRLKLKAK
ncbi:MAG: ABC transporter permease [Mollicutes bacterium]|nr:ABC transporter permease [Mollicutes bacterium]